MSLPPMAAVQPSTLTASSSARGTGRNDSGSESTGFSNVLARQHSTEPGKPVEPVSGHKTDSKSGKTDKQAGEQVAAEETLTQTAGEQALALPQIALHIAAEVAAVRQTADAGRKLLTDTKNVSVELNATAADQATRDPAAKGSTPLASLLAKAGVGHASRPAAAPGTLSSVQPETAAIETTADIRPTVAAGPLNPRQAASIAGAKQAVLAMQARRQAGEASPEAAALAEFLASKPQNVQTRESSVLASTMDLTAMQPASHAQAAAGLAAGVASGTTLPGMSPAGISGTIPTVSTPLGNPNWGADFSRQFVSIAQGANNMPHTAELRLDPPELGPLRISINISDNTASAVFVSPHAAVRQTVENALPQLQQQLAQAGISLGQTSVSDQGQPDQAAYQASTSGKQGGSATGGMGAAAANDSSVVRTAARSMASNALVDTFA